MSLHTPMYFPAPLTMNMKGAPTVIPRCFTSGWVEGRDDLTDPARAEPWPILYRLVHAGLVLHGALMDEDPGGDRPVLPAGDNRQAACRRPLP